MADHALVFRGNTLARVVDSKLELFEVSGSETHAREVHELPSSVGWIAVAPRRRWVIVHDAVRENCWLWRPEGVRLLARRQTSRDVVTAGFLTVGVETYVVVAQQDELAISTADGRVAAVVNIAKPHAWRPFHFVELPGERLALVGRLFGDTLDMVVTVPSSSLFADREAVQQALEAGPAVHDRAEVLVVGPAPGDAAVVWRDPKDEEPLDDKDDDAPDVWGLAGYYLRDLATGALVEHAAVSVMPDKHATVVATERVVAFDGPQARRIDRRTRAITELGVAAIDPVTSRVAIVGPTGFVVEDL